MTSMAHAATRFLFPDSKKSCFPCQTSLICTCKPGGPMLDWHASFYSELFHLCKSGVLLVHWLVIGYGYQANAVGNQSLSPASLMTNAHDGKHFLQFVILPKFLSLGFFFNISVIPKLSAHTFFFPGAWFIHIQIIIWIRDFGTGRCEPLDGWTLSSLQASPDDARESDSLIES